MGPRAALATLQASGGLIPNQQLLINTIPLLEARASSAIENSVTTQTSSFGMSKPGTIPRIRRRRRRCGIAPRWVEALN